MTEIIFKNCQSTVTEGEGLSGISLFKKKKKTFSAESSVEVINTVAFKLLLEIQILQSLRSYHITLRTTEETNTVLSER